MLILPTFLSFSYFFFFIKKTKQKKLKLNKISNSVYGEVDISWMDLDDRMIEKIAEPLNADISFINLSSNKIGGNGVKILLESLNGNKSIMGLNFSKKNLITYFFFLFD